MMRNSLPNVALLFVLLFLAAVVGGCQQAKEKEKVDDKDQAAKNVGDPVTAKKLLGNPKYPAICYGGYRGKSREQQPSISEIKEDLKILAAMGIRVLRTYNTQQFDHAENLLVAIEECRTESSEFEMYVMLGAWIDCQGAWSDNVDHENENVENNSAEINAAIKLAKAYPQTVKIIAVGNEAMVHWAGSYFVRPKIILKWVKHLQDLKKAGELPTELWITSSDNFASWGGGDDSYHNEDLKELIRCVDYVSLHTYPFHDTHYNPEFWLSDVDPKLDKESRSKAAVARALKYAQSQYEATAKFVKSVDSDKPIHIGETGWASGDHALYGADGSCAADEFKVKLYFEGMRNWTTRSGISCFFFEAFDENWKDASNPLGSENHFGLFTIEGKAKYALWSLVDEGVFDGLSRSGNQITKTFDGNEEQLRASLLDIGSKSKMEVTREVDSSRKIGDAVLSERYDVFVSSSIQKDTAHPSKPVLLNTWEGTCKGTIEKDVIAVQPNSGPWWGCGLEIQGTGAGENLSAFKGGSLNFTIRGSAELLVDVGFQTGRYAKNNQTNNFVLFGPDESKFKLAEQWQKYSIPIKEIPLNEKADLTDITSLLFLKGANVPSGEFKVEVKDVFYSKASSK